MSRPVILRPEAEEDIQSVYDAFEQVQTGLGNRFAGRLREVLERVESMPELYGVVWQDVRAARVKQFCYLIYYVVFGDRVEVLAVLHGARDSSVWQSRVWINGRWGLGSACVPGPPRTLPGKPAVAPNLTLAFNYVRLTRAYSIPSRKAIRAW